MTLRDRIPVCPHAGRNLISDVLILALDRIERELGLTLDYSSGFRCLDCNKSVGGSANSAHLRGLAVDVACDRSALRFRIVSAALRLNFARIGIGKNFIHLDVDTSLPQERIWVY